MTEDTLIDSVFDKEGKKYGDQTTIPPIDQPTAAGGIIQATLSDYLGRPATVQELKDLSLGAAREVIRWKLRKLAKASRLELVHFEPLRLQLIDFAYNSGEGLAIRWLQRVLRVPRSSKIDQATLGALEALDPWLVNQALVGARLQMIDLATDAGGSVDKKFEEGLENRAHSFSLLEIP